MESELIFEIGSASIQQSFPLGSDGHRGAFAVKQESEHTSTIKPKVKDIERMQVPLLRLQCGEQTSLSFSHSRTGTNIAKRLQ